MTPHRVFLEHIRESLLLILQESLPVFKQQVEALLDSE